MILIAQLYLACVNNNKHLTQQCKGHTLYNFTTSTQGVTKSSNATRRNTSTPLKKGYGS